MDGGVRYQTPRRTVFSSAVPGISFPKCSRAPQVEAVARSPRLPRAPQACFLSRSPKRKLRGRGLPYRQ